MKKKKLECRIINQWEIWLAICRLELISTKNI